MKVTTIDMKPGRVLLVPGDLHFDQHDPGALGVMMKVARAAGVTDVDLVGDTFESTGISRHPQLRAVRRLRHGGGTIKAEAAAAAPYVAELADIVRANRRGPGGLHVLTGNHEHWWAEVQDVYPGLLDTPWFELYQVNGKPLFDGWHVHAEHTALKHGPLLVCHGQRLVGSLSKYSAASVLGNYPGQNTLYGHTHRIDEATTPTFKYGRASAHGAWTIGHMKDRDAELKDSVVGPHAARHQQGFALVHFFDRGDGQLGFEVTKVRIHRDTQDRPMATWGGKVFS